MSTDAVENIFSAELAFVPLFNLALQQNPIPVVYELKLINNTVNDIENLECRFSAVPEFIHEKSLPVSKVKAGEELCINKPDIELNYNLLSAISESMKGKLKLKISDGNQILFQKDFECEAFAPDQWLGMQIMPELLTSFVTPNLDVIAHLQSSVAHELERATGSASVQGYQADKKRGAFFYFPEKFSPPQNGEFFESQKEEQIQLLEKFSGRNWNFILPQKRV